MKWGEVKTAALQKMFLSSSNPAAFDYATKNYIGMMPAAANEGLMRLAVVGKYGPKSADINVSGATVDLRTKISDMFEPISAGIMKQVGSTWEFFDDYEMLPNFVMLMHDPEGCTLRVPYYAYPQTITENTTDDTAILLDPDGSVLLALYIASELFKEDDIGLATQWRNEFEAALGAGKSNKNLTARVVGGIDI